MQYIVPSQVVAVIRGIFPTADLTDTLTLRSSQLPQLMAIVGLVRRIPPELFTVDIVKYAQLEEAIEIIQNANIRLTGQTQYQFQIEPPSTAGSPPSVVQAILEVLKRCHDSVPATNTSDLTFIAEESDRKYFSEEIGLVESAVRNGEWKAATVLAGAAIEALLLWRISKFPPQIIEEAVRKCVDNRSLDKSAPSDYLQWTLPQLIAISAHLQLLRRNTIVEAQQCKDFRNLIHPGRAIRLGVTCTRGTAFSAVAALDFVVYDLRSPPV